MSKYKYYVDGNYIYILERLIDTDTNSRLLLDGITYGTPQTTVANGLYFRYAKKLDIPTDENSDLGISDNLAKAVLHYAKAQYAAEEVGDYRASEYHLRKFYMYMERERSNKITRGRSVSVKYPGAIK
jgi:hypothetical protein